MVAGVVSEGDWATTAKKALKCKVVRENSSQERLFRRKEIGAILAFFKQLKSIDQTAIDADLVDFRFSSPENFDLYLEKIFKNERAPSSKTEDGTAYSPKSEALSIQPEGLEQARKIIRENLEKIIDLFNRKFALLRGKDRQFLREEVSGELTDFSPKAIEIIVDFLRELSVAKILTLDEIKDFGDVSWYEFALRDYFEIKLTHDPQQLKYAESVIDAKRLLINQIEDAERNKQQFLEELAKRTEESVDQSAEASDTQGERSDHASPPVNIIAPEVNDELPPPVINPSLPASMKEMLEKLAEYVGDGSASGREFDATFDGYAKYFAPAVIENERNELSSIFSIPNALEDNDEKLQAIQTLKALIDNRIIALDKFKIFYANLKAKDSGAPQASEENSEKILAAVELLKDELNFLKRDIINQEACIYRLKDEEEAEEEKKKEEEKVKRIEVEEKKEVATETIVHSAAASSNSVSTETKREEINIFAWLDVELHETLLQFSKGKKTEGSTNPLFDPSKLTLKNRLDADQQDVNDFEVLISDLVSDQSLVFKNVEEQPLLKKLKASLNHSATNANDLSARKLDSGLCQQVLELINQYRYAINFDLLKGIKDVKEDSSKAKLFHIATRLDEAISAIRYLREKADPQIPEQVFQFFIERLEHVLGQVRNALYFQQNSELVKRAAILINVEVQSSIDDVFKKTREAINEIHGTSLSSNGRSEVTLIDCEKRENREFRFWQKISQWKDHNLHSEIKARKAILESLSKYKGEKSHDEIQRIIARKKPHILKWWRRAERKRYDELERKTDLVYMLDGYRSGRLDEDELSAELSSHAEKYSKDADKIKSFTDQIKLDRKNNANLDCKFTGDKSLVSRLIKVFGEGKAEKLGLPPVYGRIFVTPDTVRNYGDKFKDIDDKVSDQVDSCFKTYLDVKESEENTKKLVSSIENVFG